MTDRITDEMVEAAAEAVLAAKGWKRGEVGVMRAHRTPAWDMAACDARAALSAVLPLMDGWIKIEGEPDTSKAPWDVRSVWGADARTKEQYEMWWSGSRFETDFDDTPTPTHWMPLPPAPKGE